MSETEQSEITVNLGELYLDEVNLIIFYLRKGSHEEVDGLVTKLRSIVIPQLEALQTEE